MSIDTEVERRCLANRLLAVVGRSLAIVIAKARSLIEERGLTASVSVLIVRFPMFKLVLAAAWVFGMLLLGLLLETVLRIPAFTNLWLEPTLAPTCEWPSRIGPNVGALVAVDLRQPGIGSRFASESPVEWALAASQQIQTSTKASNDLVVYVHGFRTTFDRRAA
jgi:hypothetical protein